MEFLVDLHVHSVASTCSELTAADIVRDTRAAGIHAVGLVEHDTFPPAEIVAAIGAAGVQVYPGVELTTAHGDLLVFGADTLPPAGLGPEQLLRWIHERGGAAILAHPFRSSRPAGWELWRLPRIAVEVRNGRCSSTENRCAENASAYLGKPAVAGSDAHRTGEVGRFATVFPRPPTDRRDLAGLVRSGSCRPLSLHGGLQNPAAMAAHA